MKWRLTGSALQQSIVREGFDKIKFPWDRLNISWMPELGWRDLNSGYYSQGEAPIEHSHARGHEGQYTAEHEGSPEPLTGELGGRRFTLGVFYPGSARIYIDYRLERYPAMAQATLAAEIAHAVDEFLPLTDAQKEAIQRALHGGEMDHHTWWEKNDYSTEYWTLIGETFMPLFCKAYSDIPFGNTSSFTHDPNLVSAEEIRRIMGIERTDYVPPAPPAPPPPVPEEEIAPAPHVHRYHNFPPSIVVHKPSHYDHRANDGVYIESAHIPEGYRACKVCKPH